MSTAGYAALAAGGPMPDPLCGLGNLSDALAPASQGVRGAQ